MSAPGFHCVIVPSLKSRSSGRAFSHIICKLIFYSFFLKLVCVCVFCPADFDLIALKCAAYTDICLAVSSYG